MRGFQVALACVMLSSAAQADNLTGWFVGGGAGAVHSGGKGTVSRTTRTQIGNALVDQTSVYQSASATSATGEAILLYQTRLWGALTGVEATYQYRDLDIKTDGSIFAPGAVGVSHIGDRGMLRSRIGLEVMPNLAIYTSNGISYAWENETYLELPGGIKTGRKDTSTWNTVFGGGIEYAVGNFLIDLRFTAAPGAGSHDVSSVNSTIPGPFGVKIPVVSKFETTATSDWTYDIGVRALYKFHE